MPVTRPIRVLAAGALLVAALMPFGGASGQSQAVVDAGAALPYSGHTLDGTPFDGNDLRGKIVLLDFWAVWCAPCITAVPKLNALQEELADIGFEVIGLAVHSGAPPHVETFADRHGIEYRVVVGSDDLPYEWGVVGYPSYFLLDREGRRVRKYVGDIPDLTERIAADVRELLSAEQSNR